MSQARLRLARRDWPAVPERGYPCDNDMSVPTPPPASPLPQSSLTPAEQLTYSTVRIVCQLADGSPATGTGFFYSFLRDGDQHVPAIVTNKHVVRGATKGSFSLTSRDDAGQPIPGKHITIGFDQFERRWIGHPANDVDLCIMPIGPLLAQAEKGKQAFFFIRLDDSLLPSVADLTDLSVLEEILMIGYPNGIWDSVNNMPILRRGITATHPNLNYEGRQEFMIDAACFPGSSGSPVFLFNQGTWTDRRGNTMAGGVRVRLLGILYAGPQHTATGEVKIVDVPTQQRVIAFSTIPNNLGLVVKAARLREFEPALRSLMSTRQ